MANSNGAGCVNVISPQDKMEEDLDKSLFQLPIRRRRSSFIDISTDTNDPIPVDLDLGNSGSEGSGHMLCTTDEADFSYTRTDSSQPDDRPHITNMAFERLAFGDLELLEINLESGVNIECENHDGCTLLVMAINDSNIVATRFLLQKGADVQHRAHGKPPLFHAVQNREDGPMLIRLLLDHGANINTICGPRRMNALHWAAAAGMVDSADYLLSRGIDIEATCAGEHTALHVAAGTGHLTVVKLLLAQGAELTKRGELGGNAMTFAASMGHLEVVKLCIEEGLPADDCDGTGLTALMSACELGHASVVELLLEKGADVNKVDSRRSTPALEAVRNGHLGVLQALINKGVDLSFTNADGQSTLEIAMSKGHNKIVRLLLTTLDGPDYPLESVSLEIASAKRLETMRSLIKSASLMHAHMEPRSETSSTRSWVEWVLDTGGRLVRQQAMSNMILVAIADADFSLVDALISLGADPNEFALSTAIVNRDVDIVRLLLHSGAGPVPSPRCIKHSDHRQENHLQDVLLNMPYEQESCLEILQMLLDSGRFNALDGPSSNKTAIWQVLERDDWASELQTQVAIMMLDSITNVNYTCNGDGGTLMHHVVRHGREDLVDYLLGRGANINAQDTEGRTPFTLACDYKAQMIQFLLRRGADPSLTYEDGRGPVHAAATAGNGLALEELSLQRSLQLDFDQSSRDGWTPLACALAADQENAAMFLIDRGANLKHTVAANGRTMLHLATAFGHEQVFDHIMNIGFPDIDARDTISHSTPLLLACAGTRYKTGSTKIVSALLTAGADIEAAGSHLDRPLHVAISTGNTAIARLLIEQGADINTSGCKGCTPLQLTAQEEDPDIMRLLLQRGAKIEAIDDSGWTPLHLCARSLEAQILIDHGANLDSMDRDGLTPMHHAVRCGDLALFRTLHFKGASVRVRTKVDGRNIMDMIEDLEDSRLKEEFCAITEGRREGKRPG